MYPRSVFNDYFNCLYLFFQSNLASKVPCHENSGQREMQKSVITRLLGLV